MSKYRNPTLFALVVCILGQAGSHVTAQSPNSAPDAEKCTNLMMTHGFLSRAQFQCGFNHYSEEMVDAARVCAQQVLSKTAIMDSIKTGMLAFDRNEKERGHDQVCQDILRDFSKIVGTSVFLELEKLERKAHDLLHQGNIREALEVAKELVSQTKKRVGENHKAYANALKGLTVAQLEAGLYKEAFETQKLGLALEEALLGRESTEVAASLHNLAELSWRLGRTDDARRLFERALKIHSAIHRPDSIEVAETELSLSNVLSALGQYQQAEKGFRHALQVFEKSGSYDRRIGLTLLAIANSLQNQNRYEESKGVILQAVASLKKVAGVKHPDYGKALVALADNVFRSTVKYAMTNPDMDVDGSPYLKEALPIYEKSFGRNHILTIRLLDLLSRVSFFNTVNKIKSMDTTKSGLADFLRYRRMTTNAIISYKEVATQDFTAEVDGADITTDDTAFNRHLSALRTAKFFQLDKSQTLDQESLRVVQLAIRSRAADAMQQSVARFSAPDSHLSRLIHNRQDLLQEWRFISNRLTKELGAGDENAASDSRVRLADLEKKLSNISGELDEKYPNYSSMVDTKPLSLETVQKLLSPDEAIVILGGATPFTDSWVVTKDTFRWHSEGSEDWKDLEEKIFALRCGLDATNWKQGNSNHERCKKLLNTEVSEDELPPFDAEAAYALYRELFGGIEDVIKDKSLFIVASGALTQLPLEVLITTKPSAGSSRFEAYKFATWFGQRQPITMLPSVASLKAVKSVHESHGLQPFIGFGNPLLLGADGQDRRAFEKQTCDKKTSDGKAPVLRFMGPLNSLFRGGEVDLKSLQHQPPLPESADELCNAARTLGTPENALHEAVYLGRNATVSKVKALSNSGVLARARVVHFATHGLIAGETALFVKTKAEPALLLTPPEKASAGDNGLLAASDVAQLNLDADWVILSACNTAAGGSESAEALSGLARAFFYAGARSILVSHWNVDSNAAVAITTGAVTAMKSTPGIGRAEALRRSINGLIAEGGDKAHPSVWGPFVLVGNGKQ